MSKIPDIKNKFKAIYNPYTRNLLVRYGKALIEHQFEDVEEWVVISFNNNESSKYFLHVQLDYDETFQLLFYPRKEGSDDLNERYGSYYNSEARKPRNIKLVHTDREWDQKLSSFLEATTFELEIFKKITYED